MRRWVRMCWPCRCRLSCCCLALSFKSRLRSWCANTLPAACRKFSPVRKTLVPIERLLDGVPYLQEYSELLDQVRGCLFSNCCLWQLKLLLMAALEQKG